MNNKICFNQNLFIICIFVFGLLIYINNNNNKLNKEDYKKTESNENTQDVNITIKDPIHINEALVSTRYHQPTIYKPLIDKLIDKRDHDAFSDPLKPPNRRLPRHIYPDHIKDVIFEQPTRGYPDNYHYYGNLIRREDNKMVKLFGRQIYPGSNQYEYYGITSDNVGGSEIKIPIKTRNDKELYDKDDINIDFLDSSIGNFKLYMNDFDRPRYNPFVIN